MRRGDLYILILVIIAVIILLGVFVIGNFFSVKESHIDIMANDTLKDGDRFDVKLSDVDGNPLANQTVKIVMMDSHGKRQAYSIVTDPNGIANTVIGNKDPGKISVNASFGGNDKFNYTSAVKTINVIEGRSNNTVDTSSSSSQESYDSSSDVSYDYSYDSASDSSSYSYDDSSSSESY